MPKRIIPDAATLVGWRKSSYSSSEPDNCVEVLDSYPTGVPIRDSKNPDGPALVFATPAWKAFLAAIAEREPLDA
ncbi:DUF397 domain-containing protein [Streptomyces sp. LX-29]|uniref:DUF397 domain-containing protein n=1 Tax=Streptomyces sp. LX-29 TaxID=2900152 RepID=UPI00240E0371|nr:DUF397 domain-containing protein [Streptomyces sp. LX-29]WFB09107.1 DUF397 domain-containing protein [Streptomyces sp. LX-29]